MSKAVVLHHPHPHGDHGLPRDELAVIRARIVERKLAEKKKAELRKRFIEVSYGEIFA